MTIDNSGAANDRGTINNSHPVPSQQEHGTDENQNDHFELTELEAEQVAGGLESLNDKCLNAIKC